MGTSNQRKGLRDRVEGLLRDELAHRKPGDQLPTERALTEQFGVSIAKVREALTLLAREGLVTRSHGRGTFVCDPGAGKWMAVVLIHDLAHPTLSFYARSVFQCVRRQLAAADVPCRGYTAFGDPTAYERLDCPEFWHDLEANQIRHVIPVGGDLPLDLTAELSRRGIRWTRPSTANAATRARALVRTGTRYLVAQGRRRLAMLAWSSPRRPALESTVDGKPWDCLFREELRAAGLAYRDQWVKSDLHPNVMAAGWQEFRDIWRAGGEKPDGLLICNDILARDAAIAIAEMGIPVPDRLMVVAHENSGSGQWFPFPIARLQVDPERDAAAQVAEAVQALGRETKVKDRSAAPTCRLIPLAGRGPGENERVRSAGADAVRSRGVT